MDVEVLIHGVPDGQDYFGLSEERTNAELFYDNSQESVKFIVETKKSGNNAYSYYSYLRYKGMVGYGGRPGSYFGLTLRVDKYYQDVLHMYNMLEMVFKKYVVGTILSQSGDSYKYIVPSFASKKAEIEQLQLGLIQLIQGSCISSKFVDLDASFIHPITTAASCNIADITDNAMLASIKKYSKVVLSPDYKTNLSKEFEKRLQEAEGKGGAIVAEKDKILVEKDGEISSLKANLNTQKASIEALRTEIKQKDATILQLKKNGELSQLIAGIKEPIRKLADYFHVQDSRIHVQDSQRKPSVPTYGRKNYYLGIVGCALSLIVLVLCLVLLFKNPKGADPKQLEKRIAELTQTNDRLTKENTSKDATIADLRAQLDSKLVEPLPTPTPPPTMKEVRIDVRGYNSGPLMTDKEYTITIKEGKNNFNGQGKWILTNAMITKGKDTDATISIKPTGNGDVTLDYQSVNCTCKKRVFQIQTPTKTDDTKKTNKGGDDKSTSNLEPKKPESNIPDEKKEENNPVEVNFDIVIDPNVTEVEMDKTYSFSVSGYDGKGVWGVYGFSAPNDRTTHAITVKAIDTGKGNKEATISYTPEGGVKKTKSFKYKSNE